MVNISSQIREIIEKACCSQLPVVVPVYLESLDDGTLRWLSPFIPVTPERPEQDIGFYVDFQMTKVRSVDEEYRTDYLVMTLYLVGGDPDVMPRDRSLLGNRLVAIDQLNCEEPGVKFRFQPSDSSDGGWIVIESDLRVDSVESLNEKTLADALDRLLECAEVHYWDVYQLAVVTT
jgi:hypothetical protein